MLGIIDLYGRRVTCHPTVTNQVAIIETIYLAPNFPKDFASDNLLDARVRGRDQDGTCQEA
jgi:hypothetical protein